MSAALGSTAPRPERPGPVGDTGADEIAQGHLLLQAGRPAEAEAKFRRLLGCEPASGDALMGLSRSLIDRGDIEGAIAVIDAGIGGVREAGRLHVLKGLLHQKRGRPADALRDFQRAIALDPGDALAHHHAGVLFQSTGQHAEAITFLRQASRLQPDGVESLVQLAEAHRRLGRMAEAIGLLDRAQALAPQRLDIRWMACWARMHACHWDGHEAGIEALLADAIAAGQPISPFMIIALGRPELETLLWTRAWAEQQMPPSPAPLTRYDRPAGKPRLHPIRLGYLSADFNAHATAGLIADLLRLHDRSRFELFGYNIGRCDGTALGREMAAALDHMVDLTAFGDREAAERIARDGIDILIDLKGFTTDSRPGILAHRPAPIQVNYLGYPGSMGSAAIDYVIADAVVAPPEHQPFFDEAIVRLPNSYQPNDRSRPGPDPKARRLAQNLPPDGFVFCCFNTSYKLTPNIFDIWMRLLRAVPGSVLWLLQSNDAAASNLRGAARDRGIAPERLVFAPRAEYAPHLARFGLADLFLDTLPVNAHTTASEALWCGVPVLTCPGNHFIGRVAASLLQAAGLPELVMPDLQAYEREALALARDPERLGALRSRLVATRDATPLFDTPRYARSFQAALQRMVDRRDAGLPPEPFAIDEEFLGNAP